MTTSAPLCPSCGQPASPGLADTDPGLECRNEACPEYGQPLRDDEASRVEAPDPGDGAAGRQI